jgi:Maltose acetyltransferase
VLGTEILVCSRTFLRFEIETALRNTEASGSKFPVNLHRELYNGSDPELTAERAKTEALSRLYNYGSADKPGSDPGVLKQLLENAGKNATIRAPFYCDYGWNIFLGDGAFVNFNAVPKRPSDPKERLIQPKHP